MPRIHPAVFYLGLVAGLRLQTVVHGVESHLQCCRETLVECCPGSETWQQQLMFTAGLSMWHAVAAR